MTLTINIDDKKLKAVREKAELAGSSLEELFEKYLDSFLGEENMKSVPGQSNSLQTSKPMQPIMGSSISDEMKKIRERPDLKGKNPLEIIAELKKDVKISADFDEKEDYRNHIMRKHA